MHACVVFPSGSNTCVHIFFLFLFFYFSLQEQWEVVWSEPVGSDMLTERGSNSVEHCPGSNNTAGRRYTAAHCAAAEESALTRSAESAQRAQGASNNVLKWSFAAKSGNVSSKRRHNTDFHAAPRASSAVWPQERFSETPLVFRPVATETKQFGLDH